MTIYWVNTSIDPVKKLGYSKLTKLVGQLLTQIVSPIF